jgi:hypothetical protein
LIDGTRRGPQTWERTALSENRRTIIAAALILIGFGLFAWFLPDLMLAAGKLSPWAAAILAAIFLLGFFLLFWLRGRYKGR